MRVLRYVWKCWRGLWRSSGGPQTGIDSHKWESKIEISMGRRRGFCFIELLVIIAIIALLVAISYVLR